MWVPNIVNMMLMQALNWDTSRWLWMAICVVIIVAKPHVHCKNRKIILTLVWLLELQVDIRSLHSYK